MGELMDQISAGGPDSLKGARRQRAIDIAISIAPAGWVWLPGSGGELLGCGTLPDGGLHIEAAYESPDFEDVYLCTSSKSGPIDPQMLRDAADGLLSSGEDSAWVGQPRSPGDIVRIKSKCFGLPMFWGCINADGSAISTVA